MSPKWRVFAFLIAAGGGVLGILGALIQELSQGSLLIAFIAAPMIEEVMKPAGVYLLLVQWPKVLTSRRKDIHESKCHRDTRASSDSPTQ